MGAWRISQARVLTRRAAAIETLGAATVLCTDKTGTLTQNRMRVAQMRLADGDLLQVENHTTPAAFHELIDMARLASAPNPVDPMERARKSREAQRQLLDDGPAMLPLGAPPEYVSVAPGIAGYEFNAYDMNTGYLSTGWSAPQRA